MCDHCGTEAVCEPLYLGIQLWNTCPLCYEALGSYETSGYVFGRPLYELPKPTSTKSMWVSYRIAAQELGYTLFTATTRDERDALHDRWGAWMTYVLRLEREMGRVGDKPRQNHYLLPFLRHLEEQYGPSPLPNEDLDMWILENTTRAPLRSTRDACIFADIPPRMRGVRYGRPVEPAA